MSSKERKPATDDPATDERRLFEAAMSGVRPLRQRGPSSPTPLDLRTPPPAALAVAAPAGEAPPPLVDGPQVRGRTGGVSERTLRQLAKGEFPVEASCNLHGYREETARRRLGSFLQESRQAGRRVVAVVCGRGLHSGPLGPVLRRVCLEGLSQAMAKGGVLAVATAPARLGGEGAFLILLRKGTG